MKVEDGRGRKATSLLVPHDAEIYDVLTAALEKEKVDLAPRFVSVQFDGEEVQSDAKAKDYVVKTSLGNPLLLMIDQEGEWPFTGTVCDGG